MTGCCQCGLAGSILCSGTRHTGLLRSSPWCPLIQVCRWSAANCGNRETVVTQGHKASLWPWCKRLIQCIPPPNTRQEMQSFLTMMTLLLPWPLDQTLSSGKHQWWYFSQHWKPNSVYCPSIGLAELLPTVPPLFVGRWYYNSRGACPRAWVWFSTSGISI